MLALAQTLVAEGRHDHAFLDRYCHGSPQFLAYLAGDVDGVAKTAVWASAICGIEASTIVELARDLATGPSLVCAAWSLQRAEFGEQPYAALIALASVLGQIGTPGGGFGLGYGSVNRMGSAESAFSLAGIPVGVNPVETFIPVARITELLESAGSSLPYDGVERRLPDTRLLYWVGGNPFHHHQDLNRLVAAWQQPECVIVHESVWNPLARHADIVLPATTTLERNDVGTAPLTGSVVAMPKAVEPVGEARSDFEICAGVAERFGLAAAFTDGLDEWGWLRRLWSVSSDRARQRGLDLPPFEEFWDKGVAVLARPAGPRVLLSAFRADPQGKPLRTPSGRIELYSEVLAAFEATGCPAHAAWMEPVEWLGAPLAQRFPLHLLSNQPATRLHSQLDFGRTSLAGKVAGREPLSLHPEDAAARGVVDGDVVEVWNDRGRCLAGAVVTDGVMPGVVVLPTGGWYDPVEPGGLCANGNPNVLTSARPTSGLAQAPAAQSCLVEVRRWAGPGEPPPVRAYDPPPFVARG
jgi:biotin/methionine sulfoxide reductase